MLSVADICEVIFKNLSASNCYVCVCVYIYIYIYDRFIKHRDALEIPADVLSLSILCSFYKYSLSLHCNFASGT